MYVRATWGALQLLGSCDFAVLIFTSIHRIKMVYQATGLLVLHKSPWPWAEELERHLLHWLIRSAPVPLKTISMDIRNTLCILFILLGQSLTWFGVSINKKQDKLPPNRVVGDVWGQWSLGSSLGTTPWPTPSNPTLQNDGFSRSPSHFWDKSLLNQFCLQQEREEPLSLQGF